MDQTKIGKFISKLRKDKKLTQEELAEILGVTSKSISRWENGKTMPDASLFEPLCKELNITINELLKGEIIKNDNQILSPESLIDYTNYLKIKERNKIIFLIFTLVIITIISLTMIILFFNKTFFKTIYNSEVVDNINIPIPRFSYYRSTSGMEEYTTKLKTLKQPDEVNIHIERYLNTLKSLECNNEIYYYNNKDNFTIKEYKINNDGIGFINTIYITYSQGNLCNDIN